MSWYFCGYSICVYLLTDDNLKSLNVSGEYDKLEVEAEVHPILSPVSSTEDAEHMTISSLTGATSIDLQTDTGSKCPDKCLHYYYVYHNIPWVWVYTSHTIMPAVCSVYLEYLQGRKSC